VDPLVWLGLLAAVALGAAAALWYGRRAGRRVILQFRSRLARYQLQQRRLAREALNRDPAIAAAVRSPTCACGGA